MSKGWIWLIFKGTAYVISSDPWCYRVWCRIHSEPLKQYAKITEIFFLFSFKIDYFLQWLLHLCELRFFTACNLKNSTNIRHGKSIFIYLLSSISCYIILRIWQFPSQCIIYNWAIILYLALICTPIFCILIYFLSCFSENIANLGTI